MKKIFKIGLIGMTPSASMSLKSLLRIFKMRSRTREYKISDPAESAILLVDLDEQTGKEAAYNSKAIVIGIYSERAPDGLKYSIKKPLIGRKVVDILDEVTISELSFAPELAIDHDRSSESDKQVLDKLEQFECQLYEAADQKSKTVASSEVHALVVDDCEVVRKAIGIILEHKNFNVAYADDGHQALHFLIEKDHFDIVFLDVVMPEMNGYKVCKKFKSSEHLKNAEVVMLTSKSSKFDRVRASLAGCDHYLTKPVSQKEFLEFIDSFLKRMDTASSVKKVKPLKNRQRANLFPNPNVKPEY